MESATKRMALWKTIVRDIWWDTICEYVRPCLRFLESYFWRILAGNSSYTGKEAFIMVSMATAIREMLNSRRLQSLGPVSFAT
jgi:hypothetical protein